jgi:hypothetical protein
VGDTQHQGRRRYRARHLARAVVWGIGSCSFHGYLYVSFGVNFAYWNLKVGLHFGKRNYFLSITVPSETSRPGRRGSLPCQEKSEPQRHQPRPPSGNFSLNYDYPKIRQAREYTKLCISSRAVASENVRRKDLHEGGDLVGRAT